MCLGNDGVGTAEWNKRQKRGCIKIVLIQTLVHTSLYIMYTDPSSIAGYQTFRMEKMIF